MRARSLAAVATLIAAAGGVALRAPIAAHSPSASSPSPQQQQYAQWRCSSEWVLKRLGEVCSGKVPWLQCERRSSLGLPLRHGQAEWVCTEGAQGAVVLVDILQGNAGGAANAGKAGGAANAGKAGHGSSTPGSAGSAGAADHGPASGFPPTVTVFAQCRNKRGSWEPDFASGKPLSAPRIRAIMKLVKPDGEDLNRRLALNRRKTLLQKEIERGRAVASLYARPSVPFSPAWYDVRGATHLPLFFMELLEGLSGWEVLRLVIAAEKSAMTEASEDLLNLVDSPGLDEEIARQVRQRLQELSVALVMQARLRLSLLDSILALQQRLAAAGLSHCDFHLGNIFVLQRRLPKPADLVAALSRGDTVFAPAAWREASPALAQRLERDHKAVFEKGGGTGGENGSSGGVIGYALPVDNLRVIDNSHALSFQALAASLNISTAELLAPCQIDRGRPDDLTEIHKTTDLLLKSSTTRHDDSRKEAAPLQDRWMQVLAAARAQRSQAVNEAESLYHAPLSEAFKVMGALDSALRTLHRSLLSEPHNALCEQLDRRFRQAFQHRWDAFYGTNSGARLDAWRTLGLKCSIETAQQSVAAQRSLLHREAAKFENLLRWLSARDDLKVFVNPLSASG